MKKFALASLSFFVPALAFAQSSSRTVDSAQKLAQFITDFVNNIVIPMIFLFALVVFVFGVFTYFIAGAADEEKRTKGKHFIIYGIVGFFVMISVYGLVRILTGTLPLRNDTPSQGRDLPQAPDIKISN